MSNLILGYNNLIDGATLSGGSWSESLPLANLKTRLLSKVARSSNAQAASTLIDIDLGSSKSVRAFGAIRTNLSVSGASYRLRGSNDITFATGLYDSGSVAANAQTPDLIIGLAATTNARYWRLEITDAANAAGYVQIGRLFIGPALAPADNYSKGAEIGYRSNSSFSRSIGGVKYFDRRTGERVFSFQLDWLTDAEALGQALELQRVADITGEVLLIVDPADTIFNQKRHFLGTLEQLSPLKNPYLTVHQAAFNVVEVVA